VSTLSVALAVVAALLAVAVVWAVVTYRHLARLRSLVQEAWRQIDVELRRRHELVPGLVEALRGRAPQEEDVFAAVERAREDAVGRGVGPARQAQHESALSGALSRLFAVAEGLPELASSGYFADLQAELTTTEDRIAAGRRFYNGKVARLNARVEAFPGSLVARLAGFRPAEVFQVNDPVVRAVPSAHFVPGEDTGAR